MNHASGMGKSSKHFIDNFEPKNPSGFISLVPVMQVTVWAIHTEMLKCIKSQSGFYKGTKPANYLNRDCACFRAALIYRHSKASISAQRSIS